MPPPRANDLNNFLGIAAGVGAGGVIADAITTSPREFDRLRPGVTTLPATLPRVDRPALPPQQRPDWSERSAGRNAQWQQRVDTRHESWNTWGQRNRETVTRFEATRNQSWASLQSVQVNRQVWRNQSSVQWQQHRVQLWNFRADRAREIWFGNRNFFDNVFDDRWWGTVRWGPSVVVIRPHPVNPWWWWTWASWTTVRVFVPTVPADPFFLDYGGQVIFEGDTVFVGEAEVPAAQYSEVAVQLATNAEPQPPPTPPEEGKPAEWLPLGVFALAQEEKGSPILIFQLSVNREGVISGGYKSTITDDQRPVTGQVDKDSQRVAWRIGDNHETIFATSLANLTLDVAPVAIHFGLSGTQTWLLVRMPEPGSATDAEKLPEISSTPPPLAQANVK